MPEPCPHPTAASRTAVDAQIDPKKLPAFVQRIVASVAEEERQIDALCLAVAEGRWDDAKTLAAPLCERRALPVAPPQQAQL